MENKTVLSAVAAVLLLLALASTAQANWTHKGKGELKENASVGLSGELTLSTSAGNIVCPVSIGTTLTASSSAGHVNSFTVSKPSECDLSGSLAAICGTNGLTKVEKTGTWALSADETEITISSIDVHYMMAGCLIPSLRLKGGSTASLDKASAIGKVTLSGTQALYNSLGEESGTGELKGTLSASPAATYGVKTGATVETVWTDAGKHLSEDGKLTLSGEFSFSGSGGSVSCPATIKLLLESSTVEEEEAEGEIESFTVSSPSSCDLGGGYKTSCGTNAISKVQQTGTATLTASAEDIAVSGLVLDYEFEKCAIVSLKVEGSPTISVNPKSISSASFSAGALEVFNSKAETIGTASAGGSASASPSGTFQLVEVDTEHEETTEAEETEATPADIWTLNGEPVGESTAEGVTFDGTGEISKTRNIPGLGKIQFGPCVVHVHGTVWNSPEAGAGHGEIDNLTITTPCDIKLNGNKICTISAMFAEKFPWTIEVTTGTAVDVYGMNFSQVLSVACPLGAGWSESGTATGQWSNETSSISFSESGDLEISGGTEIFLDGSVEFTPTEGGTLALEE